MREGRFGPSHVGGVALESLDRCGCIARPANQPPDRESSRDCARDTIGPESDRAPGDAAKLKRGSLHCGGTLAPTQSFAVWGRPPTLDPIEGLSGCFAVDPSARADASPDSGQMGVAGGPLRCQIVYQRCVNAGEKVGCDGEAHAGPAWRVVVGV